MAGKTPRPRHEITQEDLEEYLQNQDDFGLELFAFRTAIEAGYNASHGGTYTDPVTGKTRQYDVRALWKHTDRLVSVAIECKALSPTFPLVVSRVLRNQGESVSNHIRSTAPPLNMQFDPKEYAPAQTVVLRPTQLYLPGALVGKSLTQVGRNGEGALIHGDSETFDKWSQAFSSATFFVDQAWHASSMHAGGQVFDAAVFAILVVSDDQLWSIDYNDDGNILNGPHRVTSADLYVGRSYNGPGHRTYDITHLNIVTKSTLKTWLMRLKDPLAVFNK